MSIFKELMKEIRFACRTGGWKYWKGNLSCGLRHGRYPNCFDYKGTFEERFLFKLGVLVMNPFGPHCKFWRIKRFFIERYGPNLADGYTYSQYTYHPFFGGWFRKYAVKHGIELKY